METKTEGVETRAQSREDKKSYSQAASANQTKSLFRRVRYSVGVVYAIHHHKTGKYARIFVGKRNPLSIKVKDG